MGGPIDRVIIGFVIIIDYIIIIHVCEHWRSLSVSPLFHQWLSSRIHPIVFGVLTMFQKLLFLPARPSRPSNNSLFLYHRWVRFSWVNVLDDHVGNWCFCSKQLPAFGLMYSISGAMRERSFETYPMNCLLHIIDANQYIITCIA